MMDILEIVIAVIIIIIAGAAFVFVDSYIALVFPGIFVILFNILIALLVIKFIIGRNHG